MIAQPAPPRHTSEVGLVVGGEVVTRALAVRRQDLQLNPDTRHGDTKDKFADVQNSSLLCLKCLDPGSGRKILAFGHGAGAYSGGF